MDVLVEWEDRTVNVVRSDELLPVQKDRKIRKGVQVKMLFSGIWYYGLIIDTEDENTAFSSSDDEPLCKYKKTKDTNITSELKTPYQESSLIQKPEVTSNRKSGNSVQACSVFDIDSENSLDDPAYKEDNAVSFSELQMPGNYQPRIENRREGFFAQTCEVISCNAEVFSSCFRCSILLCYDHFMNDSSCLAHRNESSVMEDVCRPESFVIEGAPREESRLIKKCENKSKLAKQQRNLGIQYTSPRTKKSIPARKIQEKCDSAACDRSGKKCSIFTQEGRENLFKSFYALGDLQLQREFIARHCEVAEVKQRTTKTASRRNKTLQYFLFLNGEKIRVCKKFFLSTLSISEKFLRTSVGKITSTGTVQKEQRGGRYESLAEKDAALRKSVEQHINRFPKVESHYCRKSSSRQYLHSELTLQKMYELYLLENNDQEAASLSTYTRVFKGMNLSFHNPKKDQCSLCLSYRNGDDEAKRNLEERYQRHLHEKKKIREIKEACKDLSVKSNNEIVSAVFDLQQVIYLPLLSDNKLFYKNRLSNFNFTIYDLATKNCWCYTWHEGISKRGASEISTCVYKFLTQNDRQKVKRINLFSDGCQGQNKNSVMASMLLLFINNSVNTSEVSLRFFESFHGQNEGDSAHSTISYALKKAGDVCVPSQLLPIFRLARRKKPYEVVQMMHNDFLDFKTVAKDMRILSIRKDNENVESVNWTEMMEFRVSKETPDVLYFKTSHSQATYRSITLKRQLSSQVLMRKVPKLNASANKISFEKYNDLVSLCVGETAPIKNPEHVTFFRNLEYHKNLKS